MIVEAQPTTQDQTAHSDFTESLKQAVIDQTDNGRRIVSSIVSIMEGDAPNCTPWHQLEAAKLLRKLGLGNTPTSKTQSPSTADLMPPLPDQLVIPAKAGIQGGVDVAGECQGEGENHPNPVHPVSPGHQMSDAQTKFTNKLIRQIRVHTGDGASIVRYLTEIMEGEDPTGSKGRDRLEAIKILLGICLDSPAFPAPSSCCKPPAATPTASASARTCPRTTLKSQRCTPRSPPSSASVLQSSRRSRKNGTGAPTS